MRSTLLLASVLMASVGGVGAGQGRTPEPTQRVAAQFSSSSAEQAAKVSIVGCLSSESGTLKLTDEDGNIYDLVGHAAELGKQIGDEIEVSGAEDAPPTRPSEYSLPETTLKVTGVMTILHMNAAGVRPPLGDVANWGSYGEKAYGVSVRYPRAFERFAGQDPHVTPNFVDQDGVVTLQTIRVPKEVYPDSNFVGGSFTALVNPTIRSEGTCRQFASFRPEHTFTVTVNGVKYVETQEVELAAGTASTTYYLHSYQNGLCYEFAFDFDEQDGTGMVLMCSVQWVSVQNEGELINSLLSQVSFVTPAVKHAVAEKPSRRSAPSVVSFDHSPVIMEGSISVKVSWSTRRADYVQLRYPCVKGLFVSEGSGGEMKCGAQVDHNFPPNGSANLLMGNFNPSSVPFVLSIEPFSDGVGYPKQTKTVTISVRPHP